MELNTDNFKFLNLGEHKLSRYALCNYSTTKTLAFDDDPASLINPELILELKIIAQQMGGDFGLQVLIGQPGQGSFFSFEPPSITLDPIHILSDPDHAKFVAGHEGAHRRFSPSPFSFMESRAKVLEIFQRPGFQATVNALEDCAVNDGMCRELPGLKKYTTGYYERADKEGLQVSTPEIEQITRQLGRTPKFAKALAEIMRDWHRWRKEGGYEVKFSKLAKEGRYASGLEKPILKCLRNTRNACLKVISEMPQAKERSRKIIEAHGKKRVEIIDSDIYPEILKLLEEDISQEAIRKAISEDSKSSKRENDSIQPSEATSREIKQAIDEFLNEQASDSFNESKSISESINAEKEKQDRIQEKLDQISSAAKKPTKDQAKELASELENELKRSKAKTKELMKELERSMPNGHSAKAINEEDAQSVLTRAFKKELRESLEKEDSKPLPFDKLSERAQKELKDKFDQLAASQKRELLEQAKKELGKYEYEFIQALESKTEPEKVETLYEADIQQELAEQQSEIFEDHLKDQQQVLDQLEDARKANLNEFERAYEEVAEEVNKACNRLQRVLIPEASMKWKGDQMSGTRLNLQRAQQAEADFRYLTKLFEQRLDPTRRTHAFEILLDTSGSMQQEGKIEHAFMGCVFAAALCESLNVDFEVLEFNTSTNTRKSWSDSIRTHSVKEKLSKLSSATGSSTYDAPAIDSAFRKLSEKDALYRFIFVLTDAESSVGYELKNVLEKIQTQSEKTGQRVVVVHFGIGSGTADSNQYYRHSYGNLRPERFFTKFCEVIESVILNPEDFFKRSK